MNRKSQMEIMGLAIIVLLISLGAIFYLRFSGSSTTETIKKDVTNTKLASNMLSVILRTTDDCMDIELKDIFKACAEEVTSIDYCGTDDPCEHVEGVTTIILDDTLKAWNKKFNFTVSIGLDSPDPPLVNITNDDQACRRGRMSEIFPIPTDKGPMMIRLDICT